MSATGAAALVERDDVLTTLDPLIDDAAAGAGRLVFLGGEAGVGKTSVARVLVERAADRLAARVGACDNVTTPAPLGPLGEAVPELAEMLDDPAVSRPRLLRRLRGLLADAPTLLLLEDVHWADAATLDVLRYLGRRVAELPVLVVVTFRSDEAVGRHPLAVLRGDLATAAGVRQVALSPLSLGGVAALLARAGSSLSPAVVHRSTGGNPFYVTELIAVGAQRLPASVRDAVLARAARLSPAAGDVLAAAAVLGPRVELPLLTAVANRSGPDVDECVAAGMLVADGATLSFRHELARLAVEQSLPPAALRDLHAEALAAVRTRQPSDDRRLAYHAAGCGDAAALLRHAPRAAARAARLGAHCEAAALYRQALQVAEGDDVEHARLHEALAYEAYLTDEHEEAYAQRLAALRIWERRGDILAVGTTQRWLSRLSWFLAHNAESELHAAAAVDTLESLEPGAELAMAYSNRSQLHMLGHDIDGALYWGRRAIELARQVGGREAEMHALNNVGTVLWADVERPEGRTMLTRSLELALAADAHEHVARAYCNLGAGAAGNRLYAEADTQLRAGIAYSQDRDLDSWRVYMTAWLARSAEEQGRYAQAQRCVDDVLRQPHLSPVARIPALVVAAQLTMRRGGDPEPQLAQAWELALGTGEVQRLAPVAAARAEAAWLAGRTDALAAIVEEVWPLAVGHPRRWVLGELAWWAAVGGRPKPAPIPVAEPFARMLAGEWAAAAQAWVAVGCPLWQAIALASEPDQGVARAGLELLAELGAPAVQLALVRDRHARGLPVPRGPRGTTRTNAFRLTARELEVLTLVADGLTNAEIARRLFLSEKTVGHHVSAVLRKLGQPTRARAVGVALRSGVVRPR